MTRRLLLDENLSPEISRSLQDSFGFDVDDIITRGLFGSSDEDIAEVAVAERRIVVSQDHDWGEIWELPRFFTLGVIMLRLREQSVARADAVLTSYFERLGSEVDLEGTFTVLW